MPRPLRVFIAERDPYATAALAEAITRDEDIAVVRLDLHDLVESTLAHPPDVVVDQACDREVVTAVRAARGRTTLLVVSHHDDEDAALATLRAGADGFLTKHADPAALPRVVRALARGEAVVSRRLTRRLIEAVRRLPGDGVGLRPVRSPLSDREWEVLDLLRAGLSTVEIADEMELSPSTVRTHLKHVFRKLGVSSREEAVGLARELVAAAAHESVDATPVDLPVAGVG